MYRKDLITSEIEKLAQVLARIMGLKVELKLEEAEKLFEETMLNSFGLSNEIIQNADLSFFENWLQASNLPPEKLDSLSEFLYYELGGNESRNEIIAPKLNLIYEELSNRHKIVHLTNLHRQKIIQQYL
ncbi:hypothetical protein FA048_19090 [Pedobacter polaris]|uniref:Uncharacterized protein n=1 Tax=Pedobacter polaris TaxID=2571273 RepID=A0A4U1CHQ5_9SPHI|nr:hypothetical protein [Pedobacter polaris]TKC04787.1 hypothetical protein FA048_19090 [Pedobacter polaris]